MNTNVYLVGAGPGDPDLISVKGRECIRKADVIIYDYLASPELLKHASKKAELIYVGKKGGDHTLSQDKINALIVRKAASGNVIVRLKGGDPFIFGRGAEEAEQLINQGITFEIVPGVTSAIAAPAYAGIPLTHRAYNSSVAFITGHEDPTKKETRTNWAALVEGIGTLVFLMGVKNLPKIVANLTANGMPSETPVALVRWGTTNRQRTVVGTLADIEQRVQAAKLKAPAVIIIGHVVELREQMKWFEDRPLFGKKIVVTRARHQASALLKLLTALGASCLECPTIEVVAPQTQKPLDNALENIESYDWIVFTSVNGVSFFFKRLFEIGLDVRALGHLRTASIGPTTAKRLADFGLNSDIIPSAYRAEAVVDAFAKEQIDGRKILLPRAREARSVLPVELTKMGAQVDDVTVYHTRAVDTGKTELLATLEEGAVDLITFTSSSTVKNFHALLPPGKINDFMADIKIASIGPITTETALKLGFEVDITAEEFTIQGLCDAIVQSDIVNDHHH